MNLSSSSASGSPGELVSDPFRNAYLRALVVLVGAITVGGLLGAWMVWDYPLDGTASSIVRGQAPIFIGATIAGAIPLVFALRARRRWMAARAIQ